MLAPTQASVKEALNNLEKEREKARIESQKDNLALLENEVRPVHPWRLTVLNIQWLENAKQ